MKRMQGLFEVLSFYNTRRQRNAKADAHKIGIFASVSACSYKASRKPKRGVKVLFFPD